MNRHPLADIAGAVGYRLGDQTNLLLQRALDHTSRTLNVARPEATRRVLQRESAAWRAFCQAVAIHETYFFRHPEHFECVERFATARAAAGDPVRTAWSAGCSTGEEVWSLALTLWPHAPDLRIAGTDLNPEALATAQRARYGVRSFRDVSPLRAGLLPTGAEWTVSDRLRERALFAHQNLAERPLRPPAAMPGEIDVIFCRNVLVYLEPEVSEAVVEGLFECLSPDGMLVVGAVEVPPRLPDGLLPVPGAVAGVFQRRRAQAKTPRPAASAARRPEPAANQPSAEPDGTAELFLQASTHLEEGNLSRAMTSLNQLLKQWPDCIPAWLQLALIAHRRGDAQAVARHAAKAIRLLEGKGDDEDLGVGSIKAGWARQVLTTLGAEERR